MGLPTGVTTARGRYRVEPEEPGQLGFIRWRCALSASYNVPIGQPRRTAHWAFLSLMLYRMVQSAFGKTLGQPNTTANPAQQQMGTSPLSIAYQQLLTKFNTGRYVTASTVVPIMTHFAIDEGLYLDSRTVSFEASWRLITDFASILVASGVWTENADSQDRNAWATSVASIMGWRGSMAGRINAGGLAIVDLGGP
jgi:hypothetical protein